jgi:RuvB-like protein 1 (pontin 52)
MCTIRGTEDIISAHGIPPDLLARLLIIPTNAYEAEEIKRIIRIRVGVEGLAISEAALDKVADHGARISLRYALQLLSPSSILARVSGRNQIDVMDVGECEDLFIDARRSAAIVNAGQAENGFIS